VALTALAPFAVLVSEMPRGAGWPLALAASVHGAWLFRREYLKPPRMFVFPGDDGPVLLDGEAVDEVAVQWRGPLAFVRWRGADGRAHRLGWWPDTLPPARRRELRLAAPAPMAAQDAASMAP
jgi:toxin CptA